MSSHKHGEMRLLLPAAEQFCASTLIEFEQVRVRAHFTLAEVRTNVAATMPFGREKQGQFAQK